MSPDTSTGACGAHLAARDGRLNVVFSLRRRGGVCDGSRRGRSVDLASLAAEVRALIEAQAATIARQDAELSAHRVMVEPLKLQLARLRRMQFGRSCGFR